MGTETERTYSPVLSLSASQWPTNSDKGQAVNMFNLCSRFAQHNTLLSQHKADVVQGKHLPVMQRENLDSLPSTATV